MSAERRDNRGSEAEGAGAGRGDACPEYLAPYQRAARAMGPTFEATLWNSPEWQEIRFRVMCEMIDLRGKSVLDAGCARADFAAWMLKSGVRYGRYVGLEGVQEFVDAARARRLDRARVVRADFVVDPTAFNVDGETPDVVVFSGSLNTMNDQTALGALERAWTAAGEAVVFNFLSNRCDPRLLDERDTGPARRLPTLTLLDWALRRTPRVRFRQDYLSMGHDGTIVMERE